MRGRRLARRHEGRGARGRRGTGRLKILVQPVSRGGPAAARNRALAETEAPYVLSRLIADSGRRGLVQGLAERAERRLRAANMVGPGIVER